MCILEIKLFVYFKLLACQLICKSSFYIAASLWPQSDVVAESCAYFIFMKAALSGLRACPRLKLSKLEASSFFLQWFWINF